MRAAALVVVCVATFAGCVTPTAPTTLVTVSPRPPYVPSDRRVESDAVQALLFAEIALQKGDVPAAVLHWRAAVAADRNSPYLRLRLGEALLMLGDAEGARAAADVAIDLGNDGKDDRSEVEHVVAALRLRAVSLGVLGEDDGAVSALRAALQLRPGEPRSSSLLAQRLVDAGDLDGAEAVVARWMKDAPGVRGTVELARVFAERGQIERALGHLDTALARLPDDEGALIARRNLLMALGRYDEAAVISRALLAALDDGPAARRALIVSLALAHADDARALATALLEQEDGERTRMLVADAFETAGLLDDAAGIITATKLAAKSAATPSPMSVLEGARLAVARRDSVGALVVCDLAEADLEARLKDHAFFLCVRARVDAGGGVGPAILSLFARPATPRSLAMLSLYAPRADAPTHEALLAFARETLADGTLADDSVIAAATLVAAAGDVAGADVVLADLVARRPASPAARFAIARHRASHGTDADVLAAITEFERWRSLSKFGDDSVDHLNFMAFALAERGLRPADARNFAWRAVLADPENGYVTDTWGWTLFHDSAFDDAAAVLRRADRLSPNEAEVWFHIAVVEAHRGEDALALTAIARAQSLSPPLDPLTTRIDVVATALRAGTALPPTP